MLEILQAPNHVAAFRLSKQVSGQEYDRMIAELEARLRQHPRIAVYAEVSELRLSANALRKDVRYAFAKLGQLRRFARAGLVSDQRWLRALTGLIKPLTPIELRCFASREREQALAWASDFQPDVPLRPALRLFATTRADTYGFAWNGRVSRADLTRVVRVLKVEMDSHISVRLLGRLERMDGIDLSALLVSGLLRVKLLGVRKVARYAIVGGPAWMERYVRAMRWLSGVPMRHYPLEREQDAWSWLEAQPAARAHRVGIYLEADEGAPESARSGSLN
jgi:hypothetical protein